MKHLKKIMSLILTAIIVIAMCVPVMAEGGTPVALTQCTLTAPGKGNGPEHTYELYQIFTGTLHMDGSTKILTDIKWGQNAKGGIFETTVSDTIINSLESTKNTATNDEEKLAEIQKHVDLKTTAFKTIKSGASETIPTGYYLIKDADNTLQGQDGAYTKYVVYVVSDMTFTTKTSVPTVVKKLKEKNDTTGNETGWQDGADYDIGDNVPFQLTGTLPSDYDKYTSYKYVFHDTLSSGLTYNKDAKVYVVNGNDEVEITSSFTTTDLASIVCNDLKKISGVTINSASKIVVRYTAELNEYANKGSLGNKNEVYLEYSNNPNYTGEGENSPTGETPKDTVIVFTYILEANKVDENNRPLTGAGFTLYKIENGVEKVVGSEIKGADLTTFTWNGLDAGKYILKETTVPSQYSKIDDIEFEIVGEYTADLGETGEAPTLTGLSVKDKDGNTISGNTENGATFSAAVAADSAKVSTNVVNKKGSQLPETGGIGTTIFYVVGVVLMLGAGVLLITKRRMSAKH